MTYTYFDHSKKEIFLSTNVRNYQIQKREKSSRSERSVWSVCCRSGLILKNCELDLNWKKKKNPNILFNFLTQIGTLMCILLILLGFFVLFCFLFLPVLFFVLFFKRRCKRPTIWRVSRTSARAAERYGAVLPRTAGCCTFLNGDEILPNQKYFLHWHLTSHVA